MRISQNRILEELRKKLPAGCVDPDDSRELVVKRGRGSKFTDWEGVVYLDLSGGIFTNSLGHGFRPCALAAFFQSLTMANIHGRHSEAAWRFYGELSRRLPGDDFKLIAYNDGSYAVDRAISDILNYYDKKRVTIAAFRGGFHGKTQAAKLLVNETEKAGLFDNVQLDFPNCYRCPHGLEKSGCGMVCAQRTCEELERMDVKALVFEPIQGSGIIIPPEGYWKRIAEFCKPRGIVLFADEILTGGGRTGHFLASHGNYGIQPDIISLCKGLGNGHPLSVLCQREAITENPYARRPGERMSTFAAHPVGMAVAAAQLRWLRRLRILDRVPEMGRLLADALEEIYSENQCIGDVRSIGLMGGIEFVTDRRTKEPDPRHAQSVFYRARKNGVEVIQNGNMIRIAPPLNIPKRQLTKALGLLARSIREESDQAR